MSVYEEPYGWLRPLYAKLQSDPRFGYLSMQHQFARLIELVAAEQPAKAVSMREYTAATQGGILGHLAGMHSQGHLSDSVEIWQARRTREN
jgi:hypothetical protein